MSGRARFLAVAALATIVVGTAPGARADLCDPVPAVFDGDPCSPDYGPLPMMPGLPLVLPEKGPTGTWNTGPVSITTGLTGDVDLAVRVGLFPSVTEIPAPAGSAANPTLLQSVAGGGGSAQGAPIDFTAFVTDGPGVYAYGAPLAGLDERPLAVFAYADLDGDGAVGPRDDGMIDNDNELEKQEAIGHIGRQVGQIDVDRFSNKLAVRVGAPASIGGLRVSLVAGMYTGDDSARLWSNGTPIFTNWPFFPPLDPFAVVYLDEPNPPDPSGPNILFYQPSEFYLPMELGFAAQTYYDWNLAANFLVVLALMECPHTPERRTALERGLRAACEKRLPVRGEDWDNDAMWAALYAVVTLSRAADDPRFAQGDWPELIERRGRDYSNMLVRNQVPEGGWGYYDDPPFTQRPKWATSFSTACVVPALADALRRGWISDPDVVRRAVRYVARCRLPNGAYEYDLNPIPRVPAGEHINQIQGSLGRIQVCNWALRAVGEASITDGRLREGLAAFFDEHRYLDAARLRPVPHEAYFANAGYFYFFGHYYAALAINQLPEPEREALHARLRPHLVKALREDGSATDFLDARYDVLASTAFLALALDAGMPQESP